MVSIAKASRCWQDEREIFALCRCSGMFPSTLINALARYRARDSDAPLWVAGLRVKVVSPCCPGCSTVDSQPGSRSFARRNRARQIASQRIITLDWQPFVAGIQRGYAAIIPSDVRAKFALILRNSCATRRRVSCPYSCAKGRCLTELLVPETAFIAVCAVTGY